MGNTNHRSKDGNRLEQHQEKIKFNFLLLIAVYIAVWALILNTPKDILEGLLVILTSPAGLLTDYFILASPGAALMNSSIMTFLCLILVKRTKAKLNGVTVAAVLMVTAFSLFGKNPFNALPIIMGVLLYAKLKKESFSLFLAPAFFATALGPVVSEISFNIGLPLGQGLFFGALAGIAAGLLVPIFAVTAMNFHKGYNLYNIGFTAGIIGSFLVSITKGFGGKLSYESQVGSGYNMEMSLMLLLLFLLLLLGGIQLNRWNLRGYDRLLKQPGIAGTDFIAISGFGLTLFNMGLVGFISWLYIILVGGELNGPTIGGVLAVVAFGAFGKHVKNIVPIMIGVFIMAKIGVFDVKSTGVLIAASFGTALAPIAGTYGNIAGIIAGMVHLNIVVNTGQLHGGMNLYNNGFAAGIVAAIMIPAFEFARTVKNNYLEKRSLQLNKESDPPVLEKAAKKAKI